MSRPLPPLGDWRAYASSGVALLGLLAVDALVLWPLALDGPWRVAVRILLGLEVLAVLYWFVVHPFVRRWLWRSAY